MAADFPNSPSIGDVFTVGTQTRVWDGTVWNLKPATSSPSTIVGTVLQSTIADGTAPIEIASSTKVVNLNADLLDGYDSSKFAKITISDTPPISPIANEAVWWDATTGSLKVYYGDGNSAQWVDASVAATMAGNLVTVSNIAPLGAQAGDLWWDTTYGTLKIYYNDGSSSQWVDAFGNSANGLNTSTMFTVELDFGSTPTRSKTFVVSNAGVTSSSQIMVQQSAEAATSRSADENEMDALICRQFPGSGSFTMYVDSLFGPVTGKYKFNYTIII